MELVEIYRLVRTEKYKTDQNIAKIDWVPRELSLDMELDWVC